MINAHRVPIRATQTFVSRMDIHISDRHSDSRRLARFFSENVTPQYISHSELQGRRALAVGMWSPDLEEVLTSEIQTRLGERMSDFPAVSAWQGVIEARQDGTVVAVAFVTLSRSASVPFGILEDIVVDSSRRGSGIGEAVIRWIIDTFRRAGIRRIFLESGLSNTGAHHLFERLGFKTVSVSMMRDE